MAEDREMILTEDKIDRQKAANGGSGRADTLSGSKSLRGDDSNNTDDARSSSKDASKATVDEGRSDRA